MVAGQRPQQQPSPNLVLSGAPLQPEFGGGGPGGAGRVANHPIVLAGSGGTPPETQYGMVRRLLHSHGLAEGSQARDGTVAMTVLVTLLVLA